MPWKSRSLILSLLLVSYVVAAAMRASPNGGLGILALLLLPTALVVVWARSSPPARGEDHISPETRSAVRAVALGGALMGAARIAPAGDPTFEAVAAFGTTIAAAFALVALARIAPLGGILPASKSASSLRGAIAVGVCGAAGAGVAAGRAVDETFLSGDPAALEMATSAAAATCLLLMILFACLTKLVRRLDLGAADRVTAAIAAAVVSLVIAGPASLLHIAPPSHILQLGTWLAAFAMALACLAPDPTFVSRAQRTFLAVTILGGPIGLLAASIAYQAPHDGATIAILVLAAGVVIGLVGPSVARPLGPEQSRWLDAFDGAATATFRSEPEAAITHALGTLRRTLGPSASTPELWRIDPPSLTTVDRAGYTHTQPNVAAPALLYDLADGEPERTLRTEVLEHVEVRRADVRPALEWLRGRGATSFTLMSDDDGPIGALLLPVGARSQPLALEEVRALRTLADRMTAITSASSALARSHERTVLALRAADEVGTRVQELEEVVASAVERNQMLAQRAARGALVARYSPAMRLALDELERLGMIGAPVGLLSPIGVDPAPYAAFVHNASARRTGPFVVVDAAGPDEQRASTWSDPIRSPLRLARGGTLFVSSISALGLDSQAYVAEALGRAPSDEGPFIGLGLIVSVPTTIDSLVASGHLHPDLADRLGDRAVPLPPLTARADDLQALVLDRLGRIAMRQKRRPIGLDPRAMNRLQEHAWPGNEIELDDVLTRAVAVVDGEVLTSAHLDRIGFVADPPPARRSARPSNPGQQPVGS